MSVFSPPQPEQPSFLVESYRAELFALALSTTKLQGPWIRIYTSEEDGMSFNRYGPVVLYGDCWDGMGCGMEWDVGWNGLFMVLARCNRVFASFLSYTDYRCGGFMNV